MKNKQKKYTSSISILFYALWFFLTLTTLGASFGFVIAFNETPANQKINLIKKSLSTLYTGPVHSVYNHSLQFYKDTKEASVTNVKIPDVSGVIINHHLLAPHLISEALNSVDFEPETIIILSPNHFHVGDGELTTSSYAWESQVGISLPDKQNLAELKSILTEDPRIFPNEHGISGVMPFITLHFPLAKVIPIAIKANAPQDDLNLLIEKLSEIINDKTLLIASVDFSHELSKPQAVFHDQHAIAHLTSLDTTDISRVDVDSPESLFVLLSTMKNVGARHFSLLQNTNASEILNDDSLTDVTSYITGVFSKKDPISTDTISLLVTGDMMLDRFVATAIEKDGMESYFKNTKRFWRGNDILLTNLEGCFTDYPSKPLDKENLIFTFDPRIISTLKKNNFNYFNLGNNHSDNFGNDGLEQCKNYITSNNLNYVGDPKNNEPRYYITKIRDKKIALFGINGLLEQTNNDILNDIANIKSDVDHIVIYIHWGSEYQSSSSSYQQKAGRAFIDAGADVVIGSHPHVTQEIEEYNGKFIFYSLGNFIFDQTFSEETQNGLALGIVLSEEKTTYNLFPINNKGFKINFPTLDERDKLLTELAQKSQVSEETKKQIREGLIIK